VEVGALDEPPLDPRVRAIPEWLDLAAAYDTDLAAELWTLVDQFEQQGMVHGTVESDARETLDRLASAGLRLAVLTNNSLGSAEAALERFDLRAPLELVLAREVGIAVGHRNAAKGRSGRPMEPFVGQPQERRPRSAQYRRLVVRVQIRRLEAALSFDHRFPSPRPVAALV